MNKIIPSYFGVHQVYCHWVLTLPIYHMVVCGCFCIFEVHWGHWDFEIEILPALCWDFGRQRVCRTTGRVQRDNCPAWFLRNTSAWSWQLWKMAVLRRSWVNCHCIRLCSYASSIIRYFDVYAWLSLMVSDLFRDGLDGRKVLCQTKKRSSHIPWDLTFQDHGSWVTNGFYLMIWISCIQHGGWPSLVWCHLVRISTGDDVCVFFSTAVAGCGKYRNSHLKMLDLSGPIPKSWCSDSALFMLGCDNFRAWRSQFRQNRWFGSWKSGCRRASVEPLLQSYNSESSWSLWFLQVTINK